MTVFTNGSKIGAPGQAGLDPVVHRSDSPAESVPPGIFLFQVAFQGRVRITPDPEVVHSAPDFLGP